MDGDFVMSDHIIETLAHSTCYCAGKSPCNYAFVGLGDIRLFPGYQGVHRGGVLILFTIHFESLLVCVFKLLWQGVLLGQPLASALYYGSDLTILASSNDALRKW